MNAAVAGSGRARRASTFGGDVGPNLLNVAQALVLAAGETDVDPSGGKWQMDTPNRVLVLVVADHSIALGFGVGHGSCLDRDGAATIAGCEPKINAPAAGAPGLPA